MEKNGTSRMSTTPGLARRWSSTAPPDRSAPVAARSASIAAFASSLSSPGSWNSALPTASIALIPYPRTANAIAFATRFGVSARPSRWTSSPSASSMALTDRSSSSLSTSTPPALCDGAGALSVADVIPRRSIRPRASNLDRGTSCTADRKSALRPWSSAPAKWGCVALVRSHARLRDV